MTTIKAAKSMSDIRETLDKLDSVLDSVDSTKVAELNKVLESINIILKAQKCLAGPKPKLRLLD